MVIFKVVIADEYTTKTVVKESK